MLVLSKSLLAAVTALTAGSVMAHSSGPVPESHAPAGVMADHTHDKGEVMTGYRYFRTSYSGVYRGGTQVGADELAAAGYSMMPTGMTMEMTMLDIMYAPTDRLTLMLMPMYMTMSMDMAGTGAMHGGHGGMGMDMGHMSHEVDGVGDTKVSALYKLAAGEHYELITTLGVSVPTGDDQIKNPDGTYTHYGMQLGSGTWDLTPSVTYTANAGIVSWGAQASAEIRLEDENDAGYQLGDEYAGTVWGALRFVDWASLSARLEWSQQDAIDGHYNGPHNHSSPADIQENYGGEFVDLGIGLNTVVTGGDFTGVRLGVEWVTRIDEDYNGYQLGLDDGLNVSLSYAF